MIDFQREETELAAAVGLPAAAVLAEAGGPVAAALEKARARYQTYARRSDSLGTPERLDRDRLDSLLGELYGAAGLLTQAGALITLRDRLRRLAALALACGAPGTIASRMRREALVLRAFAREQVARKVPGGAPLAAAVAQTASAFGLLDEFSAEAELIDRRVGRSRTARVLVDAAHLADDWPERRSIGDVLSFALHHLAETAHVHSALGEYDSLCREHGAALRDELWASAEAGFARRPSAASLGEISTLDVTLEALSVRLADPRLDGAHRCSAIGELYAMAASARALEAAEAAQRALGPVLEIVRAGISAEVHGG